MKLRDTLGVALILAVPALAALLYSGPPAEAAAAPDGKAIFLAQKCNLCHSVKAAGIEATVKSDKVKGPELTEALAKQDAAWIEKFLKKQVDLDGKKHGKQFTGSDEELGAVIAWLQKQDKK